MAEGQSNFGGVQLALDATLVSAHHRGRDTRKGRPTKWTASRCNKHGGARSAGTQSYADQMEGPVRLSSRGEVGGRWSREAQGFLQCLAHCKAQGAPRRAQATWYRRWSSLLACSVSLLEKRKDSRAAGRLLSVHEVLVDARREL